MDFRSTTPAVERPARHPAPARARPAVADSWLGRRRRAGPVTRWSTRRGRRRRGLRRDGVAASPLVGVAPFDRYSARALAPLAANVDRLRVPEGRALAHQGWLVREVLVVLAGEVVAIRGARDCVRVAGGTHIGAAELLGGGTHPASLVAGANLELLVINGPAYRWAAHSLPGFATATTGPLGWHAERPLSTARPPTMLSLRTEVDPA